MYFLCIKNKGQYLITSKNYLHTMLWDILVFLILPIVAFVAAIVLFFGGRNWPE